MSQAQNGATLTEPRSIVQSLTSKFQAAADIAAIQQIDTAYEQLQTVRAQKLATSRDTLHQWMKKVEGAKWEAQRPADKSEVAQAEKMTQLERERMALAKSVNDLEMVVQREESTYNQLIDRLSQIKQRMEALSVERNTLNDNKIRAAVYRDLGVAWAIEELQGLTGIEQWKSSTLKCRIVAHKSNDVFTLTFPPSPNNAFDDAHQIWKLLSK